MEDGIRLASGVFGRLQDRIVEIVCYECFTEKVLCLKEFFWASENSCCAFPAAGRTHTTDNVGVRFESLMLGIAVGDL
jgi:hypothetical protein